MSSGKLNPEARCQNLFHYCKLCAGFRVVSGKINNSRFHIEPGFAERRTGMFIQFLLFVIAVLLLASFWELTKINSRLKKAFPVEKEKASVTPNS